MTWLSHKRPSRDLFRIAAPDGVWQVTCDGALLSDYLSRGDAIRAACLAARRAESQGGSARVLLAPGDTILAHREPQFDAGPDEVQPLFAAPPPG